MTKKRDISRRKMLKGSLLLSAGIGLSFSGWKTYSVFKSPDLSYLDFNKELIDSLTETIIPRTDTPGASDAEVFKYVIMTIKENISRRDQNTFINGLVDVQDKSLSDFGEPFEKCSPEQQEKILLHFQERGIQLTGMFGRVQSKVLGSSFFKILKRLTLEGYCTSEIGCTQGMDYDLVPGKYEPCIPLKPNQKAWSTK